MTLVIAAGGTGGHITPALQVAKDWQKEGDCIWFGRKNALEERIAKHEGIPFTVVESYPIGIKNLQNGPKLLRSIWHSRKLLRTHRARCVFSTGSFASFPTAMAAVSLRIPLIIHEQNTVMGRANKLLSRFATKIYLGMPIEGLPREWVVGNPIQIQAQAQEKTHLLVVAGSQGSQFFNQTLPGLFAKLNIDIPIIHIAGPEHKAVKAAYEKLGLDAQVYEFVFDMSQVYAKAKCVICRAGAMTLAEITTCLLPAILIPYPYAAEDHQLKNAQSLGEQGAALLSGENEARLYLLLSRLLNSDALRKQMQTKLLSLRQTNVVEKIRKGILDVYARALPN